MPSPPRRAIASTQNEYVTGGLRIEYPPLMVSLANIGLAMDAARAAGVPVVVVQNRAPAGAQLFAHESDGWQLHPAVASRPHSHRVEKTLPSAFAHTDLGQWLTHHEVDTLAIAGYMTHNCNAATAFEAMHRGMTVEFLSDATGGVHKNPQAPPAPKTSTASSAWCSIHDSRRSPRHRRGSKRPEPSVSCPAAVFPSLIAWRCRLNPVNEARRLARSVAALTLRTGLRRCRTTSSPWPPRPG